MILMPLGNELMKIFQISPTQFSWLVSSYSFSAGISSFIAATVLDRYDRRKSLLFTFSMFVVGTFLCSISPTFYWLLAARIITGIFGGLVGGIVIAILSDLIPYERRSAAMGIVSMAFAFASVIGVPLSLLIADIYGWQAPFRFIGVLAVVGLYAIYRLLPPVKGHVKIGSGYHPFRDMKAIFTDANAVKALGFAYLMVLGHFLVIPFIAPYLVRNLGMEQSLIKYIYMLGGAMTLITAPIIGKFADRIGNYPIYLRVLLGSFVPILLMTHLKIGNIYIVLFITTLFFIFASGRMIPAQTMISGAVDSSRRGAFMSLRSSLLEMGAASASFIGGYIVSVSEDGKFVHYNWLGYISVAIALSTLWLAKRIKTVH